MAERANAASFEYLDTVAEVEKFTSEIARTREIALDTEGASFHRFVDRVYLLQLSTRARHAVIDPLGESLRTIVLVFGVLLIACFVAPWGVVDGSPTFAWSLITVERMPLSAKLVPLLFPVTGALALLAGLALRGSGARAVVATIAGATPRYGTWLSLIPASVAKRSPAICVALPTPPEP